MPLDLLVGSFLGSQLLLLLFLFAAGRDRKGKRQSQNSEH